MRHNSFLYGRRGDEFYYAEHKPHARLTQEAVQHDIGPQMCARYSLTKEQITMLIGEIEVIINLGARYNIAPTQIVPASPCGRPPSGQHLRNGVSNRRGAGSRS